MDTKFKDVKVLIWDFDGTLYKPIPELWNDVREAELQVIVDHTGWTRDRAVEEFYKLYKGIIKSATAVCAHLSHINISEAAVEMEKHFDRRYYVTRDEKLVKMFKKLGKYRHATLANGVIERHKQTLKSLGVPKETFELMVTSEIVGVTKPSPEGYKYILDHTKLPPAQHMMIGDREAVDLETAKKLGMMTCLVWATEPSGLADVSLPTVYDIEKILL